MWYQQAEIIRPAEKQDFGNTWSTSSIFTRTEHEVATAQQSCQKP